VTSRSSFSDLTLRMRRRPQSVGPGSSGAETSSSCRPDDFDGLFFFRGVDFFHRFTVLLSTFLWSAISPFSLGEYLFYSSRGSVFRETNKFDLYVCFCRLILSLQRDRDPARQNTFFVKERAVRLGFLVAVSISQNSRFFCLHSTRHNAHLPGSVVGPSYLLNNPN